MKKFSVLKEDVNSVNGIAGVKPGDEPPGPDCNMGVTRRKFAGVETFEVEDDVFHKCMRGKDKFSHYKTFVGETPTGQAIREYGRKNPNSSIILQNSKTGSMIYLRKK